MQYSILFSRRQTNETIYSIAAVTADDVIREQCHHMSSNVFLLPEASGTHFQAGAIMTDSVYCLLWGQEQHD
jgi:hypothetical protein